MYLMHYLTTLTTKHDFYNLISLLSSTLRKEKLIRNKLISSQVN